MSDVTDNQAMGRFELVEQGMTAFAEYRRRGEVLAIPHVEAPPALRGTGAAGRLMEGVTALARKNGWRIKPYCSYAAAWYRRHKDAQDVLN